MIKTCQRCGSEFDAKSNRALRCPDCRKLHKVESRHQYYLDNRDAAIASSIQYYLAHKDECRARFKKYRKTHREQILQYLKQWKVDHPDYQKNWYANNKDRYRIYKARWRNKQRMPSSIIEQKKMRLRAKLKAIAEKREAEQLKREQLYPKLTHWDNCLTSSQLLPLVI